MLKNPLNFATQRAFVGIVALFASGSMACKKYHC
jgi:hypothetical protein